MRKIIIMLLSLCAAFNALVVHAYTYDGTYYDVVYRISNYYGTSLKVRIEVDTRHLGNFVLEQSRKGWASKTPRPLKDVYCADNNLRIAYERQQRCSLIFWHVDFNNESMLGTSGRHQDDVYLKNGQWLMTEGYNFPRFRNLSNGLVCINNQNCQPLPSTTEGPLFLVWGKTPIVINLSKMTVHVYIDRLGLKLLDVQEIIKKLEPQFNYVSDVFGKYRADPVRMVWLARDIKKSKESGGLTGRNAFLGNYYVTDGKLAHNLMQGWFNEMLVHEYMHLISSHRKAHWVEESLADYYSYKAMANGQYNERALTKWGRSASHPGAKLGLYQIDKQVRSNERKFYDVFYNKGAAFWNELDRELYAKQHSLDNYVKMIDYPSHVKYQTELPKPFVDKMKSIIGAEQFNALEAKYLK